MDLGLNGRICVVTGATGGIGSATARLLAREGAGLVLVGRRLDALERVRQDCIEAGADQPRIVTADLTQPDAPEPILAAAGRLDVLVNCAGITGTRPLEELPDEAWQEQWDLHVMASMRLMRAAAPRMAEQRWGRIVNVTSSSAKRPSGSLDMAYSVTKAAQLSLSRAFADRFASQNVMVNAVAPGAIDGDMWLTDQGLAEQMAARTGHSKQEVMEQMASRAPRGRLGTEEEVAAVIVFLCSEQAANVSGAAWTVDGGSIPTIF
ncbi:MAG TPA: SDR family oxidoreductase [Solirubrobacteraceae bacterium]|jgi:3-oxoacyl-[acyl-carrier protein] reductase|nr:SDR family oxidoreductase [Solirubrobacteraceae bacterium]